MCDLDGCDGPAVVEGVEYAKLGMAGCSRLDDWPARWGDLLRQLPASVRPVAVAYADWRNVAAPEPAQILFEAARLRCAAVLVDTCDKSQGNLLDHWEIRALAEFTASVQRQGMLAVLGGSLSIDSAARIAALGPDYVAVRGAACDGGRNGTLSATRVRQLVELVAELNAHRFRAFA
jgi:uncharacterized protein (UPF0264 family)